MQGEANVRQRTLSAAEGLSKRAVDRLMRSNVHNVEALRNRLKVLSSQADYNRFRTKYQTEKLERHSRIHEQALLERQQIEEKLKSRVNLSERRERAERMKLELREKLTEVSERLRDQRTGNRNDVKLRTEKNCELMARRKRKDLERRRQKKEEVTEMEAGIRVALERYSEEKREGLRAVQEQEKRQVLNYSAEMARQLELLAQKEKELIEANSQSMQQSRLLDVQLKQMYHHKTKDSSFQLPAIKPRSPTHTTSTELS